MADADFQHIRMSMLVKDVAVVEVRTHGGMYTKPGAGAGARAGLVTAQERARRLLVNFSRVASRAARASPHPSSR